MVSPESILTYEAVDVGEVEACSDYIWSPHHEHSLPSREAGWWICAVYAAKNKRLLARPYDVEVSTGPVARENAVTVVAYRRYSRRLQHLPLPIRVSDHVERMAIRLRSANTRFVARVKVILVTARQP